MALRLAALLGAIALAGIAVPAAAQTFRAEEVKKSVSQDDLAVIVGSLGHQVIEQGTAGDIYVVGQSPDGVTYFLFGTACDVNDVPGCQGIMMQARYDLPDTASFETVAKANLVQAALNTWADFEEKTLGFTRYQVLDHGVTMANIRENVNVLLSLIPDTYPVAAGAE